MCQYHFPIDAERIRSFQGKFCNFQITLIKILLAKMSQFHKNGKLRSFQTRTGKQITASWRHGKKCDSIHTAHSDNFRHLAICPLIDKTARNIISGKSSILHQRTIQPLMKIIISFQTIFQLRPYKKERTFRLFFPDTRTHFTEHLHCLPCRRHARQAMIHTMKRLL